MVVQFMEMIKCTNCGAPDQSAVTECTYCGHQPPVRQAEPAQAAATPENVIRLQGEISQFKLILTSIVVGLGINFIARIMFGG